VHVAIHMGKYIDMPKQKTGPLKRTGAHLVYSWQKAQTAYLSPIQMLNEALNLCNYKNVTGEEMKAFKERVRVKTTEVIKGHVKRKQSRKRGLQASDKMWLDFQRWARKHSMKYSPTFYRDVWRPCWLRGVEPVFE
jgi:hypothetical protein